MDYRTINPLDSKRTSMSREDNDPIYRIIMGGILTFEQKDLNLEEGHLLLFRGYHYEKRT